MEDLEWEKEGDIWKHGIIKEEQESKGHYCYIKNFSKTANIHERENHTTRIRKNGK